MIAVVAQYQNCIAFANDLPSSPSRCSVTLSISVERVFWPKRSPLKSAYLLFGEMMYFPRKGTGYAHGVVLLCLCSKGQEMVGAKIDAANERCDAIDRNNFSVQTPENIESQSKEARSRVEEMQSYSSGGQFLNEIFR
jgi:hypothetical protein